MTCHSTPSGLERTPARAYETMVGEQNGPDAELDTPAGPTDQQPREQVIG